MTKAEFVELVQKNGEYESKVAAERAVKAFIDSVTEALVKKESVSLVGFGTFSTVEVAEKSGFQQRHYLKIHLLQLYYCNLELSPAQHY